MIHSNKEAVEIREIVYEVKRLVEKCGCSRYVALDEIMYRNPEISLDTCVKVLEALEDE